MASLPDGLDAGQMDMAERLRRGALALGLLPVLTIGLVLLIGLIEPRFINQLNIFNVLRNSAFLMIAAAGQMLVLIVGGFDLSVGAVAALTSVTVAMVMAALLVAMPDQVMLVIWLGVFAGLGCGLVVGLVNGLCVAYLRVSPFMVTLGTLSVASGVALYMTTGIPIYGMPEEFTKGFGRALFLGLPLPFWIAIAFLVAVWIIQRQTKLGRYLYAIGGNMQAARVSGVPVTFYLVTAYVLCGLLASVTGILLTARVGSGQATVGTTLMLESIAAAVIGGVSLRGGVGRVEMVALSALFLSIITNGMNLLKIDSKMQPVVMGIVLIVSVALETWNERRRVRG
ncbi:MAG: ABC transporter permease [Geminicoccaceae bacterium]